MKDDIVGTKGAFSNFVLLDFRFIILIAEQYGEEKGKQAEIN